jgi:DNA-binding PadR family transcriptional regulator
MSSTRLLVLGAVRILQPVHGYDVRRELLGWHLEEWTNVETGSIYSALKTLEKDGMIRRTSETERGARPAKTQYELTGEGEAEFQTLLRIAWWRVSYGAQPLLPALAMFPFMTRQELIAAVQSRQSQLEAEIGQLSFTRAAIKDGATGEEGGPPEHVREAIDFMSAHVRAEQEWLQTFGRRLRDGAYLFDEERTVDRGVDT